MLQQGQGRPSAMTDFFHLQIRWDITNERSRLPLQGGAALADREINGVTWVTPYKWPDK